MSRILRHAGIVLVLLTMVGCAGFQRSCSSSIAGGFGSDWVIVQFDCSGKPFNAWLLKGCSVSNEEGSDGIYWLDSSSGHLVHISGWYNRVQVTGGRFGEAALLLGVEVSKIGAGKYPR